jgi:HEAT repeat protein
LKDPTSGVRRIAAAALSRIDENWSMTPEAQGAVEQLKAELHGRDSEVRNFVSKLLVSLGAIEPTSEHAIAALTENGASASAKRKKLAVRLFISVLGDADSDLRLAAAESLGRLGDSHAQSALSRALTDSEAIVREAVEAALKQVHVGR